MSSSQYSQPTPSLGQLRSRLESVNALLHAVASNGSVEDSARNSLEFAIQSLEAVTEDLAAVCQGGEGKPADPRPADPSFAESRMKEAQSEVDSGEFDLHG